MRSVAPSSADGVRARVAARTYDPIPDGARPVPTFEWVSVPGDVELARLARLVSEGLQANLHVDYVQNFARPHGTAVFRHTSDRAATVPRLRLAAGVESVAGFRRVAGGRIEVTLRLQAAGGAIQFAADDSQGLQSGGWEWLDQDGEWRPAVTHLGTSPDGSLFDRDTTWDLVPVLESGVWTLPAPVLGRPVIRSTSRPVIVTGESREETAAPTAEQESDFTVVNLSEDLWTTRHELGFRYLRVQGEVSSVHVEAAVHPVVRRGAFACSDDRLSDIWITSVYTLRQCMHELMLDGIKRDRMPWSGDQALNTLANAFSFADQEIVEASLTALGRNPVGYINGITDYSFWWVINFGFLIRQFDARAYAEREADHLARFMGRLAADTGADGVFHPRSHDQAFERAIFIDWSTTIDPNRISTSLQLLWLWCLRSAVEVLDSVEHPTVVEWRQRADLLAASLVARAWNPTSGGWTEYLDDAGGEPSPHAELFAALSGILRPEGMQDDVRIRSLVPSSTPFISGFALRALGSAGHGVIATEAVRSFWGEMLDHGARTFWEEFPSEGRSTYEMYGRSYGKSLCHAWAAGPAALLPEIVCGVRSSAPGWSRFTVDPSPGDLDWAAAVVPTPQGDIVVVIDGRVVRVEVPQGCVLERGGELFPGPTVFEFDRAEIRRLPIQA